jgi:hypothetical protein
MRAERLANPPHIRQSSAAAASSPIERDPTLNLCFLSGKSFDYHENNAILPVPAYF